VRPRRAHTRQLCSTAVELRDVWSSYATVLVDVSAGGARLGPPTARPPQLSAPAAAHRLGPGDAIQLLIDAPGGRKLSLPAVVVWAREASALGVRFNPPLDNATLEALLSSC